jgi:hypothetical protein
MAASGGGADLSLAAGWVGGIKRTFCRHGVLLTTFVIDARCLQT